MLKRLALIASTMVLLSFDCLAQAVTPGGMVFGSPMVLIPGSWPNLVNLGQAQVDDPLANLAFKRGYTRSVTLVPSTSNIRSCRSPSIFRVSVAAVGWLVLDSM